MLTEKDQEIAFSQGFIENWLDITNAPVQVKEHLKTVSGGVDFYRAQRDAVLQDARKLQDDYARLTGLSAQYLQIIQQYKEVNEALSVEQVKSDANSLE